MSPLGDAEFAAAMAALGGFEPAPRLAVAVSGGPDSLALAILAERWARARGGGVTALVVDHGLRPDSAAEARRVGAWLAARGIAHALLEWRGPKPATGIQEAARAARYALLAEWCRAHRHLHLLTAHHRDDQAETVLIRRRAGSGPDGLAGMPAVRELAGCRLLRPLLGIARPRLAALLDALSQDFVRDPSNADPAFERARLRLAGAPAAAAALAEARGFARARTAREAAFAAAAARQVALYPAGFAVVAAAAGAELLGRLAHTVGGAPYPPRRERVARLHESLAARPDRARTLGGCRFVPWRGRIVVVRELGLAAAPVDLAAAGAVVWDRRFAVAGPAPFTLGYLGQSGLALPAAARPALPGFVRAVLPALWDRSGLAGVPFIDYRRAGLGNLPALLFRPCMPLSHAGFTVV